MPKSTIFPNSLVSRLCNFLECIEMVVRDFKIKQEDFLPSLLFAKDKIMLTSTSLQKCSLSLSISAGKNGVLKAVEKITKVNFGFTCKIFIDCSIIKFSTCVKVT